MYRDYEFNYLNWVSIRANAPAPPDWMGIAQYIRFHHNAAPQPCTVQNYYARRGWWGKNPPSPVVTHPCPRGRIPLPRERNHLPRLGKNWELIWPQSAES